MIGQIAFQIAESEAWFAPPNPTLLFADFQGLDGLGSQIGNVGLYSPTAPDSVGHSFFERTEGRIDTYAWAWRDHYTRNTSFLP